MSPLIEVEGVSKKFCKGLKRSLWYGLGDLAAQVLPRRVPAPAPAALRPEEFWAVRDLSFTVQRGECLGLLGHNGAGKTTLLKMINGIIRPDAGRITVRGRVGALIALNAGFNPLLSGRENVYINAAILGLSRQETDARFEQIVAFAEMADFIDMPVQNYSSGMSMRLGFAIATSFEPDILILDEVLAVGDAQFRFKCYQRISEIKKNAAIILVSHHMDHISRLSTRTLVLGRDRPPQTLGVAEGVAAYESQHAAAASPEDRQFATVTAPVQSFEARPVQAQVHSGAALALDVTVQTSQALQGHWLKAIVYNGAGGFVADGVWAPEAPGWDLRPGINQCRLQISQVPLRNGPYQLTFHLIDSAGQIVAWSHKQSAILVAGAHAGAIADCQLTLRPLPAAARQA